MSGSKILDGLAIKTPCSANWDEMRGNDAVRFCTHCDLSVHDLAQLTRAKALKLVLQSDGRICLRIRRSPGGEVVTRPVYSRLHAITRKTSRLSAGAFTALIGLSVGVPGQAIRNTATPESDRAIAQIATNPRAGGMSFWLYGTITDANGAVIAGAKITITNKQTKAVEELETDEVGKYRVQLTSDNTYSISIGALGFVTFKNEHFPAGPVGESVLDVTLEVGSVGGAEIVVTYDSPLLAAVVSNDLDEFKQALTAGADPNYREDDGTTALQLAVARGNTEMVRELLRVGAKAEGIDHRGENPLFSLDNKTPYELLRMLLRAGADVNQVNTEGDTPLIALAEWNSFELTRALIAAGANVNAQNRAGNTPLMIAADHGNLWTVQALLAAGANVSLRNEDGETALDLAENADDQEIVELLKAAGAVSVHPE